MYYLIKTGCLCVNFSEFWGRQNPLENQVNYNEK